jgi:hypothetical protein
MTHSDLDKKAVQQARQLLPWAARAGERIDAKFADALSHARNAVTETLKRKPDGRPTIRHASRSPSSTAALARLDELLAWLAGPSVSSLAGFVRDARATFYVDSFGAWKPFIPAELWVSPDPMPTVAGTNRARGAVLHGMDLRTELAGPIDRAKRSLRAAVAVAGRRGTTGKLSDQLLLTWRTQNQAAVTAAVHRALSDSQMDADVRAGRDLVHEDYLEPIGVTT